jgi:hypothetical protein
MRKDVECTFGILKGRWRILKSGVYLKSAVGIDPVWFTCCALHNWLLEVDGLDEQWESGVASDWSILELTSWMKQVRLCLKIIHLLSMMVVVQGLFIY